MKTNAGRDTDGHPHTIRTFGIVTESVGLPPLTQKQNFMTLHYAINAVAGPPQVITRTLTDISASRSVRLPYNLSSSPIQLLDD